MDKKDILKYLQNKLHETEQMEEESTNRGFPSSIIGKNSEKVSTYFVECEMKMIQPIIDNTNTSSELRNILWQSMSHDQTYAILQSNMIMELIALADGMPN